jgi:hypothetical protein
LRIPWYWGSQISQQLAHEGTFTPSKYCWYSFLLEVESIPGPQCGRKDYVNEKFQWHRESNPQHSGL